MIVVLSTTHKTSYFRVQNHDDVAVVTIVVNINS